MSVHPRSINAALHEYKQSTGGQEFPLSEAVVREIVAEVHSVAKLHQLSREIRLRMMSAVFAHKKDDASPSPAPVMGE